MSENAQQDDQAYGRDQVVKIINSVISKVENTGDVSRDAIFQEMKELEKIIDDARSEIGKANPADINDKHIPTATDELDAIVEATATATGEIMDACEIIMEKADEAGGEHGDAITAEVMKIFEACSFQDITGQRITKTVKTLKDIEEKVSKIVNVMSQSLPGGESVSDGGDEDTRTGDEALLNGPQMAGDAISQDEIDKLLSEFD